MRDVRPIEDVFPGQDERLSVECDFCDGHMAVACISGGTYRYCLCGPCIVALDAVRLRALAKLEVEL